MWKRDREILHYCLSIQLLPAGNAGNGRNFLLPPAFLAILLGLRRLLASALDSPGLDCGCLAFLGRAGALNWELAPEADLQTDHRLALSPAASDSPGRDGTLTVILQSSFCKMQDLKPGCLAQVILTWGAGPSWECVCLETLSFPLLLTPALLFCYM